MEGSRNMETGQKSQKQEKYIDWLVFGVLFMIAAAVFLTLFHRQTLGSPGDGVSFGYEGIHSGDAGLKYQIQFPLSYFV